jgi:hypothetical protein
MFTTVVLPWIVLLIAVFAWWVMISELSFLLSDFTTIGRHIWFGDWILNKCEKLDNKGQSERATRLYNLSISKLFVCRPCHTFWMTFLFLSISFVPWWGALILALITWYRLVKNERG